MQQSSAGPETDSNLSQQANSQPVKPSVQQTNANEPEKTKPVSLAELFGDSETPGAEKPLDNDDADDPNAPLDSIDRLTKRLNLKPEQVYAIKVPMRDGAEPLTIGELKDRVGEVVDLEQRELQFDQRRVKAEGALLQAQSEIRELISMLPKEAIKPEMVQKLRNRHEAQVTRERELTLEHIPSWENDENRRKDIKGMVTMLSDYGFDESFITTVQDHRALKFIRDAYLRDKRIKDALAKVTKPPVKGQRPSSKTAKPAVRPMQQQNTPRGQYRQPTQRDRIANLFKQSE